VHHRSPARFLLVAILAMAVLVPAPNTDATGWAPNVPAGADIVMKDHRWPFWDQGTYFCLWYMGFVPPSPKVGNFYGGVVTRGPGKVPGMFMSYWGPVRVVHTGELFYPHGYGAEGASGGAHGDALFLRPGAWYRFVMRLFPPIKDRDKKTYVGWWVKDLEKNRWHTHSVVSLSAPLTGFRGNSGFVEALAPYHVHRAFERRLGYYRLDGKWHKANVVKSSGPQHFKLIEGGTVLRYDRSEPDKPGKGQQAFETKQPDQPTLDKPAIASATATAWRNQVCVQWAIPPSASPQLGYKIEVFDQPGARGTSLATLEENAPWVRARRFDLPREPKSVRLTIRDIFDQTVSATFPVEETGLLSGTEGRGLRPGLSYAYYEAPKGAVWERLPDFSALKPVKQGRVATLDDTIQEDRYRLYAIRYRGYLRVPASGLYVFWVGTCDGSRLVLDGRVVADYDGLHSASVKQFPVALGEGLHAFDLRYFKGPCRRHGGHANLNEKLSVKWEGPGFGLRRLSAGDFLCREDGLPSLRLGLKGAAAKPVLDDNLVDLVAALDLRGHRPERLQVFRGRMVLKTIAGAELGSGREARLRLLVPAGRNRLRARLWFDHKRSVDSDNILDFQARELVEGPWKFIVLGEKFPIGFRCKDGVASFRGEGFCVGYQKVKGDFTLTGHIADIALTTPHSGVHPDNWLGLFTSNVGRPRRGQGLESTFNRWGFGIYLTAGRGLRGSADHPDLAGSRMSRVTFPGNDRWLRVVRKGKRFMAFTSPDGKTWRKVAEEITRYFTDQQYVGVCFRAVPGKGRSLFEGAMHNLSLERGRTPEETRQKPRKEDLALDGRITAVVQARKNPNVLYARTVGRGLLKSQDRGETWRPANGDLTSPEALAVRSVAVHPTDSSIVLRGGGAIVGGRLRSGLWRSTDGGKTWALVTREIDFDGRGPTTLFGEVIAFCPQQPDLVAAAGETKGLFLSRDGGKTWERAGLAGERITSLAFVPKTGGGPTLVIGTFDDDEFAALGLPRPLTPLSGPARIYWVGFRNGKPRFEKSCEVKHWGVTNIGFGSHQNFATFATTRGIYYTWQHGNMFWQRRFDLPADTFYTALGYRQFMKEWRKNDWRQFATNYAAPFSCDHQAPIYRCPDRTTSRWSILWPKAKVVGEAGRLNAGVTCIAPDAEDARTLYVCGLAGIFKTTDLGRTYRLVCRGGGL